MSFATKIVPFPSMPFQPLLSNALLVAWHLAAIIKTGRGTKASIVAASPHASITLTSPATRSGDIIPEPAPESQASTRCDKRFLSKS